MWGWEMGQLKRINGSFLFSPVNAKYKAGFELSPNLSCIDKLATFAVSGYRHVRVLRAGCSMSDTSNGILHLAFDMLVFKTADCPARVGNTSDAPISGAKRNKAG